MAGCTYRIVSSPIGETIFRGDRPVVKPRFTRSGVRLESVNPEFRDIAREFAISLGHRAVTMPVAPPVV